MTTIVWEGSDLCIGRDHGVRVDLLEVVVDLAESGSLLGIEVLGLFERYPGMAQRVMDLSDKKLMVSVDEEADAVYLRFGHGRSVIQLVSLAAVAIGPNEELLSLRVRVEP